jgi:hypothetical protein
MVDVSTLVLWIFVFMVEIILIAHTCGWYRHPTLRTWQRMVFDRMQFEPFLEKILHFL